MGLGMATGWAPGSGWVWVPGSGLALARMWGRRLGQVLARALGSGSVPDRSPPILNTTPLVLPIARFVFIYWTRRIDRAVARAVMVALNGIERSKAGHVMSKP